MRALNQTRIAGGTSGADRVMRAGTAYFFQTACILMDPKKVARKDRKEFGGIGAFNLVRSKTFRELGGFSNMKLAIGDDGELV